MKTLNNIQKLSKIGNLQNITLSANLLTVQQKRRICYGDLGEKSNLLIIWSSMKKEKIWNQISLKSAI